MDNPDSDDYELMPSHELDDLRREVSALKKGSMTEGDKARVLIESMDRLTISINRLITILDDAQKDIIDEYQQSKPAEKLNQLLDQNEMIARALIAISDNMGGNSGSRSLIPPSQSQYSGYSSSSSMPQQNISMGNPRSILPSSNMPSMGQPMQQMNPQMNQQSMQFGHPVSMGSSSMPSMDELPPMDNMPPLDNSIPNTPKKKFLGIM